MYKSVLRKIVESFFMATDANLKYSYSRLFSIKNDYIPFEPSNNHKRKNGRKG